MRMRTRYQEKRQQISTPDVPPTKRRRCSISKKIKLRRTNRDESDGERNPVRIMQPVVCIPRIEIVARTNENDQVRTAPTDSGKETKRFEFPSASRSSPANEYREYESNIASNRVPMHTKSLLTPIQEFDDAIIEQCGSSKPNVDHDDRRLWVLRDVKNVFQLGDSSSRKCEKDDPAVLPLLRDQENIFSVKSTRKVKKAVGLAVGYVTPLLKESSHNSHESATMKSSVQSRRTSARKKVFRGQVDEKKFIEMLFKTEKSIIDSSLRGNQKNVEVQKIRMMATRSSKSRSFRSEFELTQELSEGNVKNIRIPQNNQPEQSSRRRSPRNLARPTNAENVEVSKETVMQFMNDSGLSMISNISRRSQKIEHMKEDFNDSARFDHGLESPLISYPLKSSFKSRKKKKLNVSFKEGFEAINELPAEVSPRTAAPTNAEVSTTYSPSTIGEIVPSGRQNEVAEPSFRGYPASVDLSPHIKFCSFVLDSFVSCINEQPKKRMSIREAAEKTEIVNICRKTLENIHRPEKFHPYLAMKRTEASSRVSSVSLEHKCKETLSPYVRLTRLSEAEISSYTITPLKDERILLKSKTEYDYGIDDVNTDDSTDDEDDPKKTVPPWASIAKKTLKTLNPHEKVPRKKIRRWMTPPKLNGITLRHLLFSKCRKR